MSVVPTVRLVIAYKDTNNGCLVKSNKTLAKLCNSLHKKIKAAPLHAMEALGGR
jgi:hypothetical protein